MTRFRIEQKTELHIHTKMTRMRGLISPAELVEYAVEKSCAR